MRLLLPVMLLSLWTMVPLLPSQTAALQLEHDSMDEGTEEPVRYSLAAQAIGNRVSSIGVDST